MANKKRKKKNGGKMKPAYAGGLTPDMASSLAQIVPGLIGAIPRTQAPGAGGDLKDVSAALGAAGSIASLLPGAGTAIGAGLNVLSSVAGEINLPSAYVPMGENQGKYSRVYGGSLQPLASDAYEVKGNNPSVTDGVELPNAFVDHGETISGDYVFSEERTNPLTGKTFAKDAKKIAKAKGKAEALPYDPAAKNTAKYLGEQEQQLANLQETINGLLGEADKFKKGSYKNGGRLDPLKGAEDIKLQSETEPEINYWQTIMNTPDPMSGLPIGESLKQGLGMAASIAPVGRGIQAVLASRAARAAGIGKYMGYIDDAIQEGIRAMQARKFRAGSQAYKTVKEGLDAGEAAARATQAGKFRAGKAASEVVRSAKPYTSTTAQGAAKQAAKEAMTNPGIVSSAKTAARTAAKDAFTQPGVISSADDMAAAVAKEIMAGSKMAPSEAMAAAKQLVSEVMKSNIKTGAGKLTAKQIAQQAFAKGKAITKSTLKEAQQLFPNSPKIKSTTVSDYSKIFKEGLAGGGMMKPAYQHGGPHDNPYDLSKLRNLIDPETGQWIGGAVNTGVMPTYGVTDQMASGVGGVGQPPAGPDAVTRADAGVTYGVNRGPGTDPMFDPMGYFGRAQVPTAAAPGNNPLTATVNNLGGVAPATAAGKGKAKKTTPFEPWISDEEINARIARSLDPLTSTDMPNLNLPYDRVESMTKKEPTLGENIPGVRGFYPDVPKDPSKFRQWWGDKSEGERLQTMEALSKAGMLLQGYDRQPLYQNNAAITRQQFDPQNALMQQQYAANAARQGLQNSGTGASLQANLQNLAANQMNAAGQTMTQYDQMNKQARTQYEQRLAQRQQENIGYKYATDQVRQQDESAYWNQFRDVVTGIGNKGREMVAQDENQRAAEMLVAAYPDIAPFLESWGIKINKKSKTKK